MENQEKEQIVFTDNVNTEEIKEEVGKLPENKEELAEYLDEHYTMEQVTQAYQHAREILQIMESTWKSTIATYKIEHSHIEKLTQFNIGNRDPKPETPVKDEAGNEIQYDPCNGLLKLTEQDCIDIFGADHPIIGVTHELTLDRVHDAYEDFYNWSNALYEFREIDKAYVEYTDEKEAEQLKILQEAAKTEEDPVKAAAINDAITQYYNKIYLEFLTEPISSIRIDNIVNRLSNADKAQYILKRTTEKLRQMKISAQFIPEIVKFESTFLPEEYSVCDGVLLMYFCDLITYCDISNRKDNDRNNAIYLTVMIDRYIRNLLKPEVKEKIKNNIIEFENRFINLVPRSESDDSATPPISDPVGFTPAE